MVDCIGETSGQTSLTHQPETEFRTKCQSIKLIISSLIRLFCFSSLLYIDDLFVIVTISYPHHLHPIKSAAPLHQLFTLLLLIQTPISGFFCPSLLCCYFFFHFLSAPISIKHRHAYTNTDIYWYLPLNNVLINQMMVIFRLNLPKMRWPFHYFKQT